MCSSDLHGQILGEGKAENIGLLADRAHRHVAAVGDAAVARLDEPAWRIGVTGDVRTFIGGKDGWILRKSDRTFSRVDLEGRETAIALPPGTDFASEATNGRLLTTQGRAIQIDGQALPDLDIDPRWTDWIGEHHLLVTGTVEAHVHDDRGRCLAIRRTPAGKFWDAASGSGLVAALAWDRKVEVWDLAALDLDPVSAARTLAEQTGVQIGRAHV